MADRSTGTRVIAVFDFDKTLSSRDNVLPFLVKVAGRAAVVRALVTALPDLARGRRDAVKAHLTRTLLRGRLAASVRAQADAFAEECIDNHLRGDVVARAEWHREQGHERVIVSASYAVYLEPVATELAFDAALATDVVVDADGRLTGALAGPNVRRAEKVRRLDAWIGDTAGGSPTEIWAYGDSDGDRELLARADHPVRVGRTPLSRCPTGE